MLSMLASLLKLKISVKIHSDLPDFVVGYLIKDRLGQSVFGTNTHHMKRDMMMLRKGTKQITILFMQIWCRNLFSSYRSPCF